MDEAKILGLARKAGFETDCKTFVAFDGADCSENVITLARLVAAAERERHESTDQRMAQIEQRQSETLRRIDAMEKAQADYYRNQQRMPMRFDR